MQLVPLFSLQHEALDHAGRPFDVISVWLSGHGMNGRMVGWSAGVYRP